MKIPHNANQLYSGVLVDIYEIPETDGVWIDHKEQEDKKITQVESHEAVHDIIVDLL